MDVSTYPSAAAWLDLVSPLLLPAEAENNLLLGIAQQLAEESPAEPRGVKLWSVRHESEIVGAALMTPPHNIVLSRQPDEALAALAKAMVESQVLAPGVVGPDDIPERFARSYARLAGAGHRLRMRQRIHACRKVAKVPAAPGEFRLADDGDLPRLGEWWSAFADEVGAAQKTDDSQAIVRRIIDRQRLFVWASGGEVVSCAGVTRPTRHGIAVYFVYTPNEHRGRGFATSCVAELTGRMLQSGRRFCCLYTDRANPTSNAVYERIGYEPVCESEWVEFVPAKAS